MGNQLEGGLGKNLFLTIQDPLWQGGRYCVVLQIMKTNKNTQTHNPDLTPLIMVIIITFTIIIIIQEYDYYDYIYDYDYEDEYQGDWRPKSQLKSHNLLYHHHHSHKHSSYHHKCNVTSFPRFLELICSLKELTQPRNIIAQILLPHYYTIQYQHHHNYHHLHHYHHHRHHHHHCHNHHYDIMIAFLNCFLIGEKNIFFQAYELFT